MASEDNITQEDLDNMFADFFDEKDSSERTSSALGSDILSKSDSDISLDDIDNLVNLLNNTQSANSFELPPELEDSETLREVEVEDYTPDEEDLSAFYNALGPDSKPTEPVADTAASTSSMNPEEAPIDLDSLFGEEEFKTTVIDTEPDTIKEKEDATEFTDLELEKLLETMPQSPDFDEENIDFIENVTVYTGPDSLKKKDTPMPKPVPTDTKEDEVKEKKPKVRKPREPRKPFKIELLFKKYKKEATVKAKEYVEKGNEKVAPIPLKIVLIVLGSVSAITVLFLVLMVTTNAKYKEALQAKEDAEVIKISTPFSPVTSSNYFYLNRTVAYGDTTMTLTKVLLDTEKTIFYFDDKIDLDTTSVILMDSKNNIYTIDNAFILASGSITDTLRFEPLEKNITDFSLLFYNRTDGSNAVFQVKLTEPINDVYAKYMSTPIDMNMPDEAYKLTLESMTFASSGTELQYKVEWKDDLSLLQLNPNTTGMNIVPTNPNGDVTDTVVVTAAGTRLLPIYREPIEQVFEEEKTLIGRVDLTAVKSLTGYISVTFSNMYKKLSKAYDMPVSQLFEDSADSFIKINSAPYTVVLERIGVLNKSGKVVIVYHAETASITQKTQDSSTVISKPSSGKTEDTESTGVVNIMDNRVKALLDTALVIRTAEGGEVEIPGTVRARREGGQLEFSLNDENGERLSGIPNFIREDQYYLKINNIYISVPPVTTSFMLDNLPSDNKSVNREASDFIVKAFESRLNVKSGISDISTISNYFSKDVLNSDIMKQYEAVPTDEPASASAQITLNAQVNNTKVYAVVQEVWRGISGGQEIRFYRTHKVTATNYGTGWRIDTDEIISDR